MPHSRWLTRATSSSTTRIVTAFIAVILAFCVSTAAATLLTRRIDAASDSLAFDSSPSIQHLSAARGQVRLLELGTYEYLRVKPAERSAVRNRIEEAARALREDVNAYLALPQLNGETGYWTEMQRTHLALVDAVRRAANHHDRGET